MMITAKNFKLLAMCGLVNLCNPAFAGSMGPVDTKPSTGLFLGLGGSYNSVKLDQYLNPVIGTSDIFDSAGTLVASGSADGPASPFHNTQTTFAPEAQVGYSRYFSDTHDKLWGIKLQYRYLGITAAEQNISIPQQGTFTQTADAPANTTFTGRATIQSAQVQMEHELDLIPFIGAAFSTKGQAYFGIGPSVFSTKTSMYNVSGFADINGVHSSITPSPTNFFSSAWLWGGVAQLGMNYAIKPSWYVDINYSYAVTSKKSTTLSQPFTTLSVTSSGDINTNLGTLFGVVRQRVTSQALIVSMNKVFEV
jgi:opacity protein-like surface antigen|tara:strand:- start:29285 stop:30208 length:924 start_codon:yes stop_codon:yes gene_type:complete